MPRFEYTGNISMIKKESFQNNYTAFFPVFEQFINKGGMSFIIKDILNRESSILNKMDKLKDAL